MPQARRLEQVVPGHGVPVVGLVLLEDQVDAAPAVARPGLDQAEAVALAVAQQGVLDAGDEAVRRLDGLALGHAEGQPDVLLVAAAAVGALQPLHGDLHAGHGGEDEEGRVEAVGEDPCEDALVGGAAPGDDARIAAPRGADALRRQGDDEQGDDQRRQQPDDDGTAETQHDEGELLVAAHEDQRQEDDHRGQGGHGHRQPHLAGAADRRLPGPGALLPPAVDVLDDDDGVVHHQAEAEHEPHHGDQVQAPPQEVDGGHRGRHREGDGEGDDQGHAGGAQEEQEHEGGEEAAPQTGGLEVVHRLDDVLALVPEDLEVDALQMGPPLQLGQTGAHAAGDLHQVAPRGLHHLDPEGGAPVDAGEPVLLRRLEGDFGHVPEPQPVLVVDDELPDLVEGLEAPQGAHVDPPPPLHHAAPGQGEVESGQAPADLERLHAVAAQPPQVQVDAHLPRLLAPDLDGAHALDALQGGADVHVQQLKGIDELPLQGGADPHDRPVVLVPAQHLHALDLLGQLRHGPVDAVPQVGVGLVHVRARQELHVGPGAAAVGAADHAADAGHRGDRLLQGAGHLPLHLGGAGVGVPGAHVEPVALQAARHQVEGDAGVGHDADHEEGGDGHDDGHRPVEAEAGEQVPPGLAHAEPPGPSRPAVRE